LVEETIKEQQEKDLLLEFAIEKSKFIDRLDSQYQNFLTHILLVAYCSEYDRELQYFNHWKQEVYNFLFPTHKCKTKMFNSSKTI
jgi:hypothetical protein